MALFIYKWTLFFLLPLVSFVTTKNAGPAKVAVKHPFYLAVTEINHNAPAKSLEISCKFFSEDLEQTLEKANKATLDISSAKDKALFDKYIPDYVQKHLALVVDGKAAVLHYVGFEKEKESVYAYFEVTNVLSVKNIAVANSLLHDFIDQQINIIHVTVGGKRQSTKLDYPETKAAYAF